MIFATVRREGEDAAKPSSLRAADRLTAIARPPLVRRGRHCSCGRYARYDAHYARWWCYRCARAVVS